VLCCSSWHDSRPNGGNNKRQECVQTQIEVSAATGVTTCKHGGLERVAQLVEQRTFKRFVELAWRVLGDFRAVLTSSKAKRKSNKHADCVQLNTARSPLPTPAEARKQ
jgi:hypothetical protein